MDFKEYSDRTVHVPIMTDKMIELLNPVIGGVYVDCTLGGGGHTEAIYKKIKTKGTIIGIDSDAAAINRTELRFKRIFCNDNSNSLIHSEGSIRLVHANYIYTPDALTMLGIDKVDGILLDLGLSSDQLNDQERGFSFNAYGKLDLRFDTTEGEPAYALINRLKEEDIAYLIFKYSEEKYARKIAHEIITKRKTKDIETAIELAEIVRNCVPKKRIINFKSYNSRSIIIDPATKTFQALRIAVNKELDSLETILNIAPKILKQNGKIIVISFHALEDKIVKNTFRNNPNWKIITKKPIISSQTELQQNPRSRSAKLRCASFVGDNK
ncbi:MAG: 16S rRNA (cytosine(1402)-N(4))-methyltransferase RsmH [Planctomycetaceae bacterium]|jgi:16S rRNA (cytosine1402-N4)-methyltransferase|nr:16S rRNA (cytosine(1402)-N(4))-methyltransferase RsmH [Planctomycetaceae bacterium]